MKLLRAIVAGAACFAAAAAWAAEPKVWFAEPFDNKLADGWSWLRENPAAWRIKEKGLEIKVEPGAAQTVKNVLVRLAPDRTKGKFAIDVTITNHTMPTQQFEQAGITWYTDGKPVFKLVKELIDGSLYIIPGKKPLDKNTVELRLIVSADSFTAQYRAEGAGEFQTAASGKLPPGKNEQVSLQCYHGPAEGDHWIRFEKFQIVELDK